MKLSFSILIALLGATIYYLCTSSDPVSAFTPYKNQHQLAIELLNER